MRPSKELERALHTNQLDLALVEDAVQGEGLMAEPYMEDELVGICSPGGPFEQGGAGEQGAVFAAKVFAAGARQRQQGGV